MPAAKASQQFVPIKEIRDGVAVLKTGGLRTVLLASAVNFALKSDDEQQAIIMQFQSFLNGLEFPIQVFIESRKLDIRPYMAYMEERYAAQTTDLMRLQTREYISFIKSLAEGSDIMSKRFFVVVPYDPAVIASKNSPLSILSGFRSTPKEIAAVEQAAFTEQKSQLDQRVAVVADGLTRTGIRVASLGTEELLELYYRLFDPGALEKPMLPGEVPA